MSAPSVAGSRPANSDKRRYVRDMFEGIAPRYDLLNHLLSLNIDKGWRRAAVARLDWEHAPSGTFLDACAGTLDLAIRLAGQPGFGGKVVATDFAPTMLRLGREKRGTGAVRAAAADTLELPFGDARFDGAMVGFGIRNVTDVAGGIAELFRVLRPGARLVILDFTTPRFAPLRAAYLLYFHRVLPLVGRLVSGHPTAYTYLPSSVAEFPAPERLQQMMATAGFVSPRFTLLTGGIAAVHWGTR